MTHATAPHRCFTEKLATSTSGNDDEYICQVGGACSLCSGCWLDTVHSFAQPIFMFNMTAVWQLTANCDIMMAHVQTST